MKDSPSSWQICDLFHENVVFMLGQGLDLWSEMFDSGTASDESVITLPPLGALQIADSVLKPLLPVLELFQLLLIALLLGAKLFQFGIGLIHKVDLLRWNEKRPLCRECVSGQQKSP